MFMRISRSVAACPGIESKRFADLWWANCHGERLALSGHPGASRFWRPPPILFLNRLSVIQARFGSWSFRESNAGEPSQTAVKGLLVRSIEVSAVEVAVQVGDVHLAALAIQC